MRPVVTDQVAWSVCESVSLSVTIVSPAKTAEPIEMSFGLWMGPIETMQCIRWGPCRYPTGRGNSEGKGRPIVKYRDYRACATAIRQITLTTCYIPLFHSRRRHSHRRIRNKHTRIDSKPLKLAGVPQTTRPISAASGPKFTILWEQVEEILLLNKFFFRLSIRALVAKI